jgi:hypothetical protein
VDFDPQADVPGKSLKNFTKIWYVKIGPAERGRAEARILPDGRIGSELRWFQPRGRGSYQTDGQGWRGSPLRGRGAGGVCGEVDPSLLR